MSFGSNAAKAVLVGGTVVAGLSQLTESASAAGFAIREQSAQYQGMSFAGNGAGRGLSVMFWNPAGAANKSGPGINMESHYSVIFADSSVNVTSVEPSGLTGPDLEPAVAAAGVPAVAVPATAAAVAAGVNADVNAAFAAAPASSGGIADPAVVPSSYASYQLSDKVFVGLAINSPFGLVTDPENDRYKGAVIGRKTKLFTTNANPTIAYKVSPMITIGAGAQIQYGDGKLKFASGTPNANPSVFDGDSFAFGATAGVMLTPMPGTRIGVGWRSRLTQELEGTFTAPGSSVAGVAPAPIVLSPSVAAKAKAKVKLPDTVTVSFEQALSSNFRIAGTFEWANWSVFDELRVIDEGTGASIEAIETNWDDSYFYSLGGEYDYSPVLTLRAGAAYEISPTSSPEKRLTSIPDADRVWLSAGATYKWSAATSFDLAYTHVFVEDETFVRDAPGTGLEIRGETESSVDIISASMKTRW